MSDTPTAWAPRNQRFRRPQTVPAAQSAVGGGKSPYRLGRDFERSIRGRLERVGWLVQRSALSKGAMDLMAIHKDHQPLLVQCKRNGDIGSTAWNELCELAWAHGALAVVCYRTAAPSGTRQTSAFMRLDKLREPRKPGRPWTEINHATLEPVPLQLTAL